MQNNNLRSRDKRFDEGDKVVVLDDDDDDDDDGKLRKRWQGPATVVRVKSPCSYLVDMDGGRVRHIHANKMRKFHVIVQSCNIISENDVDFGRVLVPVTVECDVLTVLPSAKPRVSSGRCRISPPRFLAECCKRQLNQGSFVLLYFRLSSFFLICIEFVYMCFPVLFCLSVSVK